QIAGCNETGRSREEFGKPREYRVGIGKGVEAVLGCLRVQKAAVDDVDGGGQGSGGKGIEAKLGLGAACKRRATAAAWRFAGFIVGDAGNIAVGGQIEAVDAAADAQVSAGNCDRRQRIPGKPCALLSG